MTETKPLSSRGGTGRENVSVAAAAAPLLCWQLIATAPKDETRILVWRGQADSQMRRIGVDFWHNGCWWHSRPDEQPTHWMHVRDCAP